MKAELDNMEFCPKFSRLNRLIELKYLTELILILQIISLFIGAKRKGVQRGLKGQCALVPEDLKKLPTN